MPMSAPLNVNTSPIAASTLASITPIGGTKNDITNIIIPKIAKIKPNISCIFVFVLFFIFVV